MFNAGLVGVGMTDSGAGIWISPDSVAWELIGEGDPLLAGIQMLEAVAASDEAGVVAVGVDQSASIEQFDAPLEALVLVSPDGRDWRRVEHTGSDSLPGWLYDVAISGETVVAVGDGIEGLGEEVVKALIVVVEDGDLRVATGPGFDDADLAAVAATSSGFVAGGSVGRWEERPRCRLALERRGWSGRDRFFSRASVTMPLRLWRRSPSARPAFLPAALRGTTAPSGIPLMAPAGRSPTSTRQP